jgi:hypothetical protein
MAVQRRQRVATAEMPLIRRELGQQGTVQMRQRGGATVQENTLIATPWRASP